MRKGCLCINWPMLVLSRALVGSAQVHVSNWIKIKSQINPVHLFVLFVFFTCILEKRVYFDSTRHKLQENLMCLNFGSYSRLTKTLK